MVYRKSDYLCIAILAIVYALLAKLVLAFFAANGVISLIWPPSGLAITCLLIGGNKYWPGIFIGALAGNSISGNPVDVSFAIATGNTLEALFCTFLLTRANQFNDKFEQISDFFMLGFAASLSACVAALIGVGALVLKGISTQQELFANLIYWWQGDVLGILFLSPLLLVWKQLPRGWFKRERVLETIACFGLAFLAGQVIFLGWFHDFFGITARGFWVFIFVVWSAVRFGRHGVLLTLALTALQMLIGTVLQSEGFVQNLVPTGMLNFWFYMVALTLTGVSLALVIEGRDRAEAAIRQTDVIFSKLSQQVPGVIYQFRLYPDGRSCFPFASESIQEIYEVTPEQVREDASAVFAILHPEDYDSVVASIQHSANTLTRWRHEYRVVLPRQGECWRLGESEPEKLEDGSVVWYGFISDISERKKAEGEIYQSESILSATINTSLDAVIHMDAAGMITRWSTQAEKTFGWTREEAVGRMLDETIIPQRYREAHIRGMKHFLASGEGPVLNSRIELSALHREGHEFPVELSITPLKIADRYEFSAFIRDITRRKRSDERIQRLKHLYQALSEVNQAIVRMEKQDELFPLVCRCAVEFGGMNMAWVGQLDETKGLVLPVASYGSGLEYLDEIVVSSSAEVPEGRGPIGTAMRENKPIVVNDYFASPLTLPWQKKANMCGWNSAAAFPILRGGQPFGVLSVYHLQTNAFDAETIALLTEMSTDIAFALDNFDRKVQRMDDEESLQLAASIYETSSEAMMVMDAESRVLAINPAFTTITGYTEEEAIGKSLDTFKSNHHDEAFYQAIRDEINNTGKWQGEIWARRKNGEVYPTLVVINTIYNKDGSVLRRVWLFSDISKRKETEEFIWRQANYDLLTGLPNRRMFQDRVEQEFKKVHRANLPLVLLFLDLDYFKEVNDTLGHATGDMLLKEAAQRLGGCVRESDTVARFGGDEFTILLSDLDDNDTVNRVVHSILQALSKPFKLNDETVYLTASIGVTCYPDDGLEIETLIKNADQAMYAAKAAGRNGYSYFTPTMQAVAQARMKLANDLRSAMRENQFWVAYQPIVDLKTGKIIKAETLVRWQHPKLGLVSPAEFIPVAEHTGLINEIGEFVFLQATQQVKRWQKLYDNEFQVSVNVSPVQFNDKSGKYKTWRQQLKSLGLSGKSIVVEITEGLLLEASDLIKEKLIEYRDAGIQVALDDFGTGYSSLSYLKKFDIDYIKIDQSFVRNLSSSSGELALCEAMIVMAHKLGMTVIAEGVETLEQRELLTEIGCDYAQGYLFSRPLPMDEFEQFLLSSYQ